MKMYQKLCIFLVLVFLTSFILSACSATEEVSKINAREDIIDEENILSIVEELSSEKYKGRLVGTEENKMAAEYVAAKFKEIGLENPEGLENYMQYYSTQVLIIKDEPIMQLEDAEGNIIKSFKYFENFLFRALSSYPSIDITADLHKIDSLEDLSGSDSIIKDKIGLFPISVNSKSTVAEIIDSFKDTGLLAGIGEFDIKSPERKYSSLVATPMRGRWMTDNYDPYLVVDNDTFKEINDAADKGLRLHIKCNFSQDMRKKVPNVIGMIPGSDPVLKNEYIVIGAHFDHVGDNKNGTYNPGALDNASGTAGLIEIARIIKSGKIAPKKTIIFAAFNGEEAGMTGSLHYVENPVYPLDKSVMICMDMIGCSAEIPITIASAEKGVNKLQNELCEYAEELKIKYTTDVLAGSDHSSFSQVGVESVLLINQDWLNGYHSPDDTLEDVDKMNMEQIVKLVLYYADKNAY